MTPMPSEPLTRRQIPANWVPYTNFTGIDRSRDPTALELPMGSEGEQPMYLLEHGWVDRHGIIKRDNKIRRRNVINVGRVDTAAFYAPKRFVWAATTGASVDLWASNGQALPRAFQLGTTVTMNPYHGNIYAMGGSSTPFVFNGSSWQSSNIPIRPQFGVTLFDRMFVAGMPDRPTEVHASRIGNPEVMPDNETPNSSERSKAAFIDVRDMIGVSDPITGLGVFEGNRLAIFTTGTTLVYQVSADYTQWAVDQASSMHVGCVSPRAVVNVGRDLLFCSRYGVHVLTRSEQNGLTVMPLVLSERLYHFYRDLVRDTPNKADISAFYDPDEEMLHIFFPRAGDTCIRLSATMGYGYQKVHWSLGSFIGIRCGASYGGDMVYGTPDGLYTPVNRVIDLTGEFDAQSPEQRGRFRMVTPTLWHSNQYEEKSTISMLLHATGNANVTITATDDQGRELTTLNLDIDDRSDVDDSIPIVPLTREYRIPFQYTYRGIQLAVDTGDDEYGDVNIIGFAIELRRRV